MTYIGTVRPQGRVNKPEVGEYKYISGRTQGVFVKKAKGVLYIFARY